jgi:uncharacterized membrane protein YozB (DUF420 family)
MQALYPVVLAVHNIVRWIIVILAVVALFRAYSGWLGRRAWSSTDRSVGIFLASAMDIQFLFGLILYFLLSPVTRLALQNLGAAMGDAVMRFFFLEHAVYMLLAVVFVHIGSAAARRAGEDVSKHKRAALWFTLAVLAIILGMPWSRPLLPLLG